MRRNNSDNIGQSRILVWLVIFCLVILVGIMLLFPSLWIEIVNPWNERDLRFCSKKYDVCVDDKPEWSVQILPRDFFRQALPAISFFALHFDPTNIGPDIEAAVIIPPPEKLKGRNYDIFNSMDYLLLVLQRTRVLYKNFHELEHPLVVMMNGRQVAVVHAAFNIPGVGDFELQIHAFVDKEKAYSILYRTPKGKFDRYRTEAMKIVESLRPAF